MSGANLQDMMASGAIGGGGGGPQMALSLENILGTAGMQDVPGFRGTSMEDISNSQSGFLTPGAAGASGGPSFSMTA